MTCPLKGLPTNKAEGEKWKFCSLLKSDVSRGRYGGGLRNRKKEGLKDLWNKIKGWLAHFRRAGRIKKRRSSRERARACFFRDPFKYARSLLEEKKTGTLQTTQQELEQHFKDQLGDNRAGAASAPGPNGVPYKVFKN